MSQLLNIQSLEDFLSKEVDDISTIHLWYEKLSEYELDGTESAKDVNTVLNAMRYLMNFSFTAAEELKEVAEQEAVAMAEKEEQWEEQRLELKDEIASLRERITVRADAGESSEAFSLKSENRELQQLSRDRDREMADQRDRFESLVARADTLTRERDSLMDHRAQLEDTIRELNRRLSSKSEDASNEWETKKLKLRNEQAVTLSRQMQAVVAQNDELRLEVDRVSEALEDATRLIEDSSRRLAHLTDQLRDVRSSESELRSVNEKLSKELEETNAVLKKFEDAAMDSSQILKHKIEEQYATIETLSEQLYRAEATSQELMARVAADTTAEKEAELDKLKAELVAATKMARSLLGQPLSSSSNKGDAEAAIRIRIVQMESQLEAARAQIESLKKAAMELEEASVQKDVMHSELAAEVERLRELKFGDAREEIARLAGQMKIRETQIARLTNHCTMLQIELGRYAEGLNPQLTRPTTQPNQDRHIRFESPTEKPLEASSESSSSSAEVKEERDKLPKQETRTVIEDQPRQSLPVIERVHEPRRELRNQTDWEQQAMLIAGLYYELMTVLEELNMKNGQMVEMEHTLSTGKRAINDSKAKLKLAYEEIVKLKKKDTIEESTQLEENKAELMELRRLAESVRIGGSEMERRSEESTRKLVGERIEKIRLSRAVDVLRSRCSRAETGVRRMRERTVNMETQTARQIARLQYDLDTSCMDLAVLQNKLIQSVPLEQYEKLSKKYRQAVKHDIVGADNIEDQPPISIDLRVGTSDEGTVSELQTKNAYLKKMVTILTDQNEFWSTETDILQKENEELKRFIEDVENESDLNGILGAIEHRLLETIREQQETARDQARDQRKQRDSDEERAKRDTQRKAERRTMLQAIVMLHRALQSQRDNNMATVTLQQMETLRGKILETREAEKNATEAQRRAEELRSEAQAQLTNVQSTKRARDAMVGETADSQSSERALRNAYNTATAQTARAERLQTTLRQRDRELSSIHEELDQLQSENEKLLSIIASGDVWRSNEKEKNISGSSQSSDRVIVKTIVDDNSKEFQLRLGQIKKAAEECIQGYKDQLANKEAALNTYRDLLRARVDAADGERTKEIVREERSVPDAETESRLREAIGQIARLQEEVAELESANMELYRERRKSVIPLVANAYMQTEEVFEGTSARESSRLEPERRSPVEETHRSQASDLLLVSERRDEELKHKNEIRNLQERIRRLTTTNRGLLAACEKIKEDAIEELTAHRREETGQDAEMILNMRVDLDRCRTELRVTKKRNADLQKEIEAIKAEVESGKKNNQEEVSKWHERKRTEESIGVLRRKLKDSQEKEQETTERIAKREKRLEEMRLEAESRQRDIERLNRRMRELKAERDSVVRENQQTLILKDRQIVLEDRIRQKDKELILLQSRLKTLEVSNDDQKKKLDEARMQVRTTRPIEESTSPVKSLPRQTTLPAQTKQPATVTSPARDTAAEMRLEQQLTETQRMMRLSELRLREANEKLVTLEKDHAKLSDDYGQLVKKFANRDDRSTGAVAVLGDKLQAKDREISMLKTKIASLERRLSQ